MKFILWLGVVPLWYGIKLLYKWTIVDFGQWPYLNEEYKRALPIRLATALALILVGFWLFLEIGDYLRIRYVR